MKTPPTGKEPPTRKLCRSMAHCLLIYAQAKGRMQGISGAVLDLVMDLVFALLDARKAHIDHQDDDDKKDGDQQ